MEDQSAVYREFEAFDFSSVDFQNGVLNLYDTVLDGINAERGDGSVQEFAKEIPQDQKARLSMQAKSFYFCEATGNIFNIEDYEEWKRQQDNAVPQAKIEEVNDEPVEKLKDQHDEEEPEYSSNYQNIVERIINGEPIPGIKDIPNTIAEGQASENKAELRKKPWEVAKEQEEAEHTKEKIEANNEQEEESKTELIHKEVEGLDDEEDLESKLNQL